MFKGSKMKKFVLILLVVMITSFAIAGVIFVGEYGKDNFSILRNDSHPDLRPNDAVDVNEEKTEDISSINSIYVSTPSENINFIPSDASEIKAHFYGYYSTNNKEYKPEFTATVSGDELRIKVDYKPNISMLRYSSNLKLDIYLPKTYSNNLQVNTSSGSISIDEIIKLESFICKTTSGSLTAKLVNAKKADLGASSGSMKISGTYDNFNFNATSGSFNSDGITAKYASLGTSSGSIKINASTDELKLHSTSGSLTADPVSAKRCTLSSSSGRITLKGAPGDVDATLTSGDIDLEYSEYDNNINIRTSSGSTGIKLPQNSEFHLKYDTSSGSGRCDFPITLNGAQVRNSIEGTVISDRNSITVKSSSGDLNIIG